MNRTYQGVRALLVVGLVVGIAACNNPTASSDSPAGLVKTSTSIVHTIGSIKNAGSPPARPTMLARVLVAEDGQVIGILFSISDGDFCESRDGIIMGFVSSKRTGSAISVNRGKDLKGKLRLSDPDNQ
jgi:hypothetical protein